MLPLMVLSLYGLIRGIDPELERAAQNLGASPFRAALLTTLPLARHGMLSASLADLRAVDQRLRHALAWSAAPACS